MQQDHALRVALKDRPRFFQAVVLSLFSIAVFTLIICIATGLQKENHPADRTQQAKQPSARTVYASLPTAKR